jgi:hypothetical protein
MFGLLLAPQQGTFTLFPFTSAAPERQHRRRRFRGIRLCRERLKAWGLSGMLSQGATSLTWPPGTVPAGLALEIDTEGTWSNFRLLGQEVPFPGLAPRFFLGGKPAQVTGLAEADGALILSLKSENAAGVCRIGPRDDVIRFTIEIEGGCEQDMVGIELPLPAPPTSVLHLPTHRNWGQAIDAASPEGRDSGVTCGGRQFCAVEMGPGVLSLIGYSDKERFPIGSHGCPWSEGGFVADGALWVKIACLGGTPWELAAHPSLDEAVMRYRRRLERDYGAIPWREDPNTPGWFADIRMVVTLDMLRSHGEVMHNYGHVRDLCRELRAAGLGGGILFYLPGYNDRYDAGYPLYGPCEALGGADGFAEMIAAIHDAGHRVMAHTNPYGADPYQAYFEEVEDLALAYDKRLIGGKIGPYSGWPGLACPTPIDFDSGQMPLAARVEGTTAVFETCHLPKPMEAFLTLSGVRRFEDGRLRVHLHYRQLTSRPGELADGTCRFPVTLRFTRGVNEVKLEFVGGMPDLSHATYRIADAVGPPPPNDTRLRSRTWTHPIVRMDYTDSRWIGIVRDRLVALVRDYGVDALHTDGFNIRSCRDLTDLGWRLHEPYIKVYYHLCKAEAFVPTGKVCDMEPVPDALTDEQKQEVERLWTEATKWHCLPNIRINYRDYGLDPRTLAAFREVLGSPCT